MFIYNHSIDTKNITKIIINNISNTNYNVYIYFIRNKIRNAKSIIDLTNILKQMGYTSSTDNLVNIITDSFIKYPLTDIELQQLSIWEQLYITDIGIFSYVITTFWLCAIQSIQENEFYNKNK